MVKIVSKWKQESWLWTWGFWWEPFVEGPWAAQRVLSPADSWLSTSPVVCVFTRLCVYSRRQDTASRHKHNSQPSESPPPITGPGILTDTPWSSSTSSSWSRKQRRGRGVKMLCDMASNKCANPQMCVLFRLSRVQKFTKTPGTMSCIQPWSENYPSVHHIFHRW